MEVRPSHAPEMVGSVHKVLQSHFGPGHVRAGRAADASGSDQTRSDSFGLRLALPRHRMPAALPARGAQLEQKFSSNKCDSRWSATRTVSSRPHRPALITVDYRGDSLRWSGCLRLQAPGAPCTRPRLQPRRPICHVQNEEITLIATRHAQGLVEVGDAQRPCGSGIN